MKNSKLFSIIAAGTLLLTASTAFAEGDVAKGKKVAKKCVACHTLKEGGKNRLGPNLFGILNKKSATNPTYKYSKAMANSGLTWDEHTFLEYITKPRKVVKGTKMSFPGIKKAAKRADLLAYFKTLRSGEDHDDIMGNVEAGKRVAKKTCTVCHSFDKGGKVVYGPNLFGIYGKKAASVEGYKYSDALKNSGLVWNDKNLAAFASNPEQFVKGTTARFPGLKSTKDAADILAYIKTLK